MERKHIGATSVEYGLLIIVGAIVAFAIASRIGSAVISTFTELTQALNR